MLTPKVYIVLLNYNGWADTLECLESLAKLTFPRYQIIVVDNCSENNSLQYIQEWANGSRQSVVYPANTLCHLSHPPVGKPIPYKLYSRIEAESGGDRQDTSSMILIQTGANLGFAGGNNVALRYILERGDGEYVWLLNNDTVVEPDSLMHLVDCHKKNAVRKAGIVGAKVRYYHNPALIQCIAGASYNKWFGYSQQIGNQAFDQGQFDTDTVKPDLIIGACMLVSTSFLKTVGLLNEEYFLYFEEQDWSERARRNGYTLAYTTQAVIYHKEGGTIGASQWKGNSPLSDYYLTRSKLLFTEKYFGGPTLMTVKLSFAATLVNRLLRKQFSRIPMLIKLVLNPHTSRLDEKFTGRSKPTV
ncbi:glycosyltransferase family 2 protein [Spirosoma rigui]|uniref:glycosyltransferase family 2 protein n=1 Tax=Spirosoma rigui TaxID=564064 RepID=UPI0014737F06|nr:glycosyltransferase family 2 protein [Spirosoma rigui]